MIRTRKHPLNESVFESIDTEHKAYWLGFLLADGSINIRSSGQAVVKLTLQTRDKGHLEKFKTFLGTDLEVKEYRNSAAKCGTSCELAVTSKKMVSDLANLGIGPRKSHTVEIPAVREDLVRHLIRGIWDGDGSVLYRPSHKKYPDNFSPTAQICGNEKVLNKINDIFESVLGLKKSKLSKVASIYLFRKQSRSAQKVINYLYKDCSIALDRKLEKAQLGMAWKPRKEVTYFF